MSTEEIEKKLKTQDRSIRRLQGTIQKLISWIGGSSLGVLSQEECEELFKTLNGT
jgi:hypothetical protein